MFALAGKVTANGLLCQLSRRLVRESRAKYQRDRWPEAITQQTLDQFLRDINYFQEPEEFVNIGLKIDLEGKKQLQKNKTNLNEQPDQLSVSESQIDNLLGMLGEDARLPELDVDDVSLSPDQLANMAMNHGIFRDLFDQVLPNSDHISFTPEQAKRLDRLIPDVWITDLPHSRVERHRKKERPLYYFEPIINVCARFIHEQKDDSAISHFAHTAYHGNIIPSSEALVKPSITLDGRWLLKGPYSSELTKINQFQNWTPSNISCYNFDIDSSKHFYSIVMLNLDSLHPTLPNLHWFVANISLNDKLTDDGLKYEELCEYLPVHGIRGFGYSRYVFLVLRHDSKLDTERLKLEGFSLDSRKFNTKNFLDQNKDKNILPVGVSWFQTTWDETSNDVFHNYYEMQAPAYDMIQPKYIKSDVASMAYPGKIPFNIFLDHSRERKDIDKQILLERLKTVDPYDYKDQYVPPKVPPTVFDDGPKPSWMENVSLKKKLKVGYWRGLRPASVTLPLNNNADLDYPIRPFAPPDVSPPSHPNPYPARPRKKLIKDLPYSWPVNEHQSVIVRKWVRNMIK